VSSTHKTHTHTHTLESCELLKSNKPQDFMLHGTRSSSSSSLQPKFRVVFFGYAIEP